MCPCIYLVVWICQTSISSNNNIKINIFLFHLFVSRAVNGNIIIVLFTSLWKECSRDEKHTPCDVTRGSYDSVIHDWQLLLASGNTLSQVFISTTEITSAATFWSTTKTSVLAYRLCIEQKKCCSLETYWGYFTNLQLIRWCKADYKNKRK